LGTFCGKIINDIFEMDSVPIWVQAIGVFQGCLLGVLIPKLILGSSSNSRGVNRSTTMGNLLGNLKQDDIKSMLISHETHFNQFTDNIFDSIDKNKDGQHDTNEIRE